VEAIPTASYLHARTPSRALDGKSPYEMLHRHRRLQKRVTEIDDDSQAEDDKPKLHHLRRFGCLAYRRIPKEQRIDTKMGACSKPCMMLGYVHNTTKIWRIWDPEQRKVVNCSDVEFDENQTAHISCIDNENDVLGIPEQEPIYTEEQVVETGQTGQVVSEVIAPRQSGQVAEPRLQVASGAIQPRLQVTPGEIQPSAEKADHQTPDEVVTDPMPSPSCTVVRRTDIRTGQGPSSRTTDLRTGQVPSSRTTDLRTGQVLLSRNTDLRTGHCTNQERRVTRSHCLSEHTALAAHTASTANLPNPPDLLAVNPSNSDPRSYREALNSPLYKHWKSAMQEEYASLMENNAFTLVKHTESKPIGCKWVYKRKHYPDRTLRYKARLVVKGYEQVKGVDFDETYAPVGKRTTLRYLLCFMTYNSWKSDHLEVVTAFLNPAIDEVIFAELPEGIDCLSKSNTPRTGFLHLNKALYGLKQAPRLWHQSIDGFFPSICFHKASADHNL